MKKSSLLLTVLFLTVSIVNLSAMKNTRIGELIELFEQNKKDQQQEDQKVPVVIKIKIANALTKSAKQLSPEDLVEPRRDTLQNIDQQEQNCCTRKRLGITFGCGIAFATAAWYIHTHYENLTWKELYAIFAECFENSYF